MGLTPRKKFRAWDPLGVFNLGRLLPQSTAFQRSNIRVCHGISLEEEAKKPSLFRQGGPFSTRLVSIGALRN